MIDCRSIIIKATLSANDSLKKLLTRAVFTMGGEKAVWLENEVEGNSGRRHCDE